MNKPLKIALAGPGAFGVKHLEAIAAIDGLEVVSLVGDDPQRTAAVAQRFHIGHVTTSLDEVLQRADIEAVFLCTPTPDHARQAIACLRAGKHVQVEIPMADNLADAEELVRVQQASGLVATAGHTRRFNPSHAWLTRPLRAGTLHIQQMDVQTFFMRRTNINAAGEPRSWTDHLLWHHACHTVDLFQYQTGEQICKVHALQGPRHATLGIAMDMALIMQVPSGALCTLSLSFNNDGPLGSFFRYICDRGTWIARYDELVDGHERPVDVSQVAVSLNGIELQDRDFLAAIRDGITPRASVASVLPAYRVLAQAQAMLAD